MDDDQEYVYETEEGRFEAGYEAFTRTEFERNKTVEEIAAEAGIVAMRRRGEVIRDPVFKFYVYVNAVVHRFIDEDYTPYVKHDEVTRILESIRKVQSPQYKNPEAFVLGYSIAKSGSINEKQLAYVIKKLPSIDNVVIKPMDLLRYANLWLSILK